MNSYYSKCRLLAHGFSELPKDINGRPDSPDYETFLKLSEMRAYKSVRNGINGIWSGRYHELASELEMEVFIVLEGQVQVLSIREGYFFASEQVISNLLEGRAVSRNQVLTIDFVLTRAPLNAGGPLRYMGLSCKPGNSPATESGKRRAAKERLTLAPLGWEWDYVRRPNRVAVANHKRLRNWAKAHPLDDADQDAAQLAAVFYRTTSVKTLRGVLAMIGKRLGIPEAEQFFVFAVAYYFGYIQLDHAFELNEDRPLVLKEPARTLQGWRRK